MGAAPCFVTRHVLQALAQKAQSQDYGAAGRRMLEGGCLGYFDFSKVAVEGHSTGSSLTRSRANVVHALPPPMLLVFTLSALVAVFC